MNAENLSQEIRKLIDTRTLREGMSELEACQVAGDALDISRESYSMRLWELRAGEEE